MGNVCSRGGRVRSGACLGTPKRHPGLVGWSANTLVVLAEPSSDVERGTVPGDARAGRALAIGPSGSSLGDANNSPPGSVGKFSILQAAVVLGFPGAELRRSVSAGSRGEAADF